MSAIDTRFVTKGVPTDLSGTFADSASHPLVKATGPQRVLNIVNIGTTNIGITFLRLVAAIGQPGTITIQPGQEWSSTAGFLPNADFYIIGTAGQPYTAWYF